jgi:uncharacterized protein (TIGR00255 family)
MLRSMTGFGSGSASDGHAAISVEVKSVNHRFCEVKARLPRELAGLEAALVQQVRARVARGALDVFVRLAGRARSGVVPVVDVALARELRRALGALASELGVPDDVSLRDLAAMPEVVRVEEAPMDPAAAEPVLREAVARALDALVAMREREGAALGADLEARRLALAARVQTVGSLAATSASEYRQRLTARVAELAAGLQVDGGRLEAEVVMFAERTDVAEELTRLASHLQQFQRLLASTEASGRQLDFLVQEMNREVNTIGSKCQHGGISAAVVEMKVELERIREQVQNVE